MDLDKINMDLVESLLEWIVDGKHDYPPGKNPVVVRSKLLGFVFQCGCWCNLLFFLYPGAVLVFLPGLAEIKMLYEQLMSNRMFNNRGATRSVSKVMCVLAATSVPVSVSVHEGVRFSLCCISLST